MQIYPLTPSNGLWRLIRGESAIQGRTYMDYVLRPTVRVQSGGCLVRVAEDARRCVVFFGTPSPGIDDDLEPWGTGFLVRANDDRRTCYLVTAAHVVMDKMDCPFAIRFNDHNNSSALHHVDTADWQFHPTDETVDVAVLEIVPPEWADCIVFPQHMMLSDFKFTSKSIGPGDTVYTVGLWSYLRGRSRNKPFVHVGYIGMVPQDDKVPVKNWIPGKSDPVEVEAYLTEGQPLPGASGSPVFVSRTVEIGPGLVAEDPHARTWAHGSVWLLGLHSDAYFERADISGLGNKFVPRGVNIVVPSMRIWDVMDKPELKKKRVSQMNEKRRQQRSAAVLPEKTSAPLANDENPTHREDFTRLVGAAARKPEPKD